MSHGKSIILSILPCNQINKITFFSKQYMSKSQHHFDSRFDSFQATAPNFNNQQHHRSKSKRFSQHKQTDIGMNILFKKARDHYKRGELKQALFYYEQSIRIGALVQWSTIEAQTNLIPPNKQVIDSLYFAGVISLALKEYSKSQRYLRKTIQIFGNYKEKSLLFLAICYNKLSKYQQCLKVLNQLCLQDKPIDALFYRGKLKLKNMLYTQAAKDFKRLIQQIGFNSPQAKLYLLQSQYYSVTKIQHGQLLQQIKSLIANIKKNYDHDYQLMRRCYNLKIDLLIASNRIQQASQQLIESFSSLKRDSWTIYLQSLIYKHEGKLDQQILLLNQCITIKDHKRSVIKAIQTLVLQAVQMKDFYEAFQYSKRNNYLKIQKKSTLSLFKIVEAVTFLMKKKYGEALLSIGSCDPEIYKYINGNTQYVKNLHFSTLGYAYFSLGQHQNALSMYQNIEIRQEDPEKYTYQYNKRLCEGIISYKQGKIQQSIKIFQTSTDYLMRAEPYFYISVILVQKSFYNGNNHADPDLVSKVIDILDSGLKVGQNYQMYYYRGLLYFYLGMNAEALDDIDRAVQKSQQNVARFFYLRGLIFFQQRNYQNAIAQLTTCLSIDDKYYDAYLQRAKIKLLSDDLQEAYEDLNSHPLSDQWKPLFLLHQHQFTSIYELKIGEQNIIETAAFQLGKFEEAGASGKVILAIIGQNYEEVMNLLQDALDINFQIGCLGLDDLYLIKSYCCFKLGLMNQCIQMLQKSQQNLKKYENCLNYGQQDEKKLLAIKMNVIFAYYSQGDIGRSIDYCQNLINDVYEGQVYDELNKVKSHLQLCRQNQSSETNVQLFSGNSMISDYFPMENIKGLKFKYLLPFPKIRITQIENVPFQNCVLQFTINYIDNRAEAPWMKRDENGVIFTNKIQIFDKLKLYTESQQIEKQKQVSKNSKQRLKQELQLDAQVLSKLEKLSKNIKNSKSN